MILHLNKLLNETNRVNPAGGVCGYILKTLRLNRNQDENNTSPPKSIEDSGYKEYNNYTMKHTV